MPQKLIEHKLRKIEFEYSDTIPWTEQDEALLNSFVAVHDYELQRKQTGRELIKKYSERNKQIEYAREELNRLKEKFAATRLLADHLLEDIALQKTQEVEKFYAEVYAVNDAIAAYDKIMRPIGDDALDKEKEKFFDEQNEIAAWEAFDEINLTHSQHYETNAIDIVSFDKADEQFKTYLRVVRDSNNSAMDYMNRVINNYNTLMLETELQYKLFEEFIKRVELLKKITVVKAGNAYFNLN